MSRSPSTLFLITARAGSKGVPDKNVRLLGGTPLLAWRIKSALPLPGEVWLSTDSEEYAAIGRQYGAQTPFLRPHALSTDTASSVDVCLHAMQYADAQRIAFDLVCLLQPTSPFVTTSSLQLGINTMIGNQGAHSVVAVKEAVPGSFFVQQESFYLDTLAMRFSCKDTFRRQDVRKEITPCGGFYISRWKDFLANPTFYTEKSIPVTLYNEETLDIDSEFDFLFAEFICAHRSQMNV